MTIHTPKSLSKQQRRLNGKVRRAEDLRKRVEIALNLMYEGLVLHSHFDRRWGPTWTLSPGNWPVVEEVARALIADPEVISCGDGLFPDGPAQSYVYAEETQEKSDD